MRDKNRIYPFCMELAELWSKYSDIRFGQLINNFQSYCNNDLFYMEDDKFLEKFKEYLKDAYY